MNRHLQGNYIIKANIVEDDRLQAIPVTTFVDVKSVSWRPDTQKIELEVGGEPWLPWKKSAR